MRLQIDCTYTRLQAGEIGITRVVRGLVHGLAIGHRDMPAIELVAFHSNGFMRCQSPYSESADNAEPTGIVRRLRQTFKLTSNVRVRRLIKACIPVGIQVAAWRAFSRFVFDNIAKGLPPVSVGHGNVLILADAGWNYDIWSAADKARNDGAKVITVVYDLIPISHPKFCPPAVTYLFADWILGALRHSDAILCISDATRCEVERFCQSQRISCPPITSFRLGSNLPSPPARSQPIRAPIRAIARQEEFFLTVGSIEPRKNHDLILDAVDICHRDGDEIRLVIVGRPADGSDTTVRRIENHPQFGGKILFLTDCNDSELDFLYRHARALIFASLAEGFGLPLVEARQRACSVLASKIPAFEELADGGVQLFHPDSAAELARLMRSPIPAGVAAMPEFSWTDSAEQFLARLTDLLPAVKANTR